MNKYFLLSFASFCFQREEYVKENVQHTLAFTINVFAWQLVVWTQMREARWAGIVARRMT